jgi:uncharacterized protein with von Willebrand factor type A (vWA) domain
MQPINRFTALGLTAMMNAARMQSAVMHDKYDKKVYDKTVELSEPIQELLQTDPDLPDFAQFVEDVFYSFFKPAPLLTPEEKLTLTAQMRRRILEEMMLTNEYKQVRGAGTAQNEFASILATAAVVYQVLEKLDEKTKRDLQELAQTEQQAQQCMQEAQTLEQQAQTAEAEEEQHQLLGQAQQRQQQATQKQQHAEALAQALQARIEQIEDQARRAARAGLKTAGQEIAETNNAIAIFSQYGDGAGPGTQLHNMKQKFELAKRVRNNGKLKLIAELAGKMVNTALHKQRTKVLHPPDEIVGVTLGNDLPLLLPAERVKLDDEFLELLFYQQFVERSLMQWEMIGHEPQGKGPVLVILDSSRSMTQPLTQTSGYVYTKEIWSKAVILALMVIARLQKRDFGVVHFSAGGQLQTWRFPKAIAQTEELLACCDFLFNGGTSFDEWEGEALKLVEESMFDQADLVVISDGDARITPAIREDYTTRRTARKLHAYGVLLADKHSIERGRAGENLASVTDLMITITDLANDKSALDTLFSI